MNQAKFYSALTALILWAGIQQTQAQIALSPSFVFIDSKSGVGDLYVSNSSSQAYEVTISFAFGYPASDSVGNLVMNYDDPAAFAQFALDSMIRAFPRSFILPAGEQRTVRIQVLPGERKKEGFFFTRMKVMAKPQSAEVAETVAENVATRISFNFEQITAVFYHNGEVSTGLEIQKVDAVRLDSTLVIRPTLVRTGNSPFIGSMFVSLTDEKGNTVSETQSTTTVYFDAIRAIDLDLAGVAPGTYTLRLSFESRRSDIKASDLVQAPAIEYSKEIVIQ